MTHSSFLINERNFTRAQCEAACSTHHECVAYTTYQDVWCQTVRGSASQRRAPPSAAEPRGAHRGASQCIALLRAGD